MSQASLPLVVNTTGPDGVAMFQAFRDALLSCHRGASRPPYAVPGLLWIKEVGPAIWQVYIAGDEAAHDALIATYDPTTGVIDAVPASRTISAGAGLSGGGDLTANRSLSLNLGSTNAWSAAQTVADNSLSIVSGAVAWNVAAKQKTQLVLTESPTMSAATGMVANGEYALTLIQNATGGWEPGWNAMFKGMANLDLDKAPNRRTRLSFESDGANLYLTGCLPVGE